MKSITYYVVSLAIWLKQTKKIFSNDPIDYKRLRKDDVKNPSKRQVCELSSSKIQISDSLVTELFSKRTPSKKVILYFHGGALVYGPTLRHWNTISRIVKVTNSKAFLVDYPKAPEHQITEVNEAIDAVYNYILTIHSPESIMLMGDSAGATLAILLSNPSISNIERNDLMLSRKGVVSAKKMSAGGIDLRNQEISPIYGSFKGFVPTYLFIATNDIMYPDGRLFEEKLRRENVEVEVTIGEGMPHIWPLLPLMRESKTALKSIFKIINPV
jgi:acetyl esterase/lipase